MENLDPNQLPMLPDPTEESALPSPVAKLAPTTPTPTATPNTFWFRTKQGKLILGVGAAVAVVSVFLFSQQLGQLLNLFGTKAGQSVTLSNISNPSFMDEGHEEKNDAGLSNSLFQVPTTGENAGRLMLNDPGDQTL